GTAGRHGGRAAQRSLDRSDGRRHGGAPLVTPPDQPGSRDNGGGLRQPARLAERDSLPSARRVVVKSGSSSLTDQRGRLDDRRLDEITAGAAGPTGARPEPGSVPPGADPAALGPPRRPSPPH